MKRFPRLIQIWLVEFIFSVCLASTVAGIVDRRGTAACPPSGEGLDSIFWLGLMVAFVFGFFVVRGYLKQRILEEVNDGQRYLYYTTHPSYGLLSVITIWLPWLLIWGTRYDGCVTYYQHLLGYAWGAILAAMFVIRLIAWHGVSKVPEGKPGTEWTTAWRPVVGLVLFAHAIVFLPIGYWYWKQQRDIRNAMPVKAGDRGETGLCLKVEGPIIGEPQFWAPQGTGRGGNNYAGGGVLVRLESGGEALLLAEATSLGDLREALAKAKSGRIAATGRVVSKISANDGKYYGFTEAGFPAAGSGGRVFVRLGLPD